jgi:hypothetical protein
VRDDLPHPRGGDRSQLSTAEPTRASLRKLLQRVLPSDSDFDAFCLDYYPDVHGRLSNGIDRVAKANALIQKATPGDILRRLRQAEPQAVAAHVDLLEYEDPPPPPRAGNSPEAGHHGAPFRRHLPPEDITALHSTALLLGLASSRLALLSGVDAAFVAGLPASPNPGAQLYTDIDTLNALEALADGSVPLRAWLGNARALTAAYRESAAFQSALDRLATPPSGAGGEPEPARPPPERRSNAGLSGPEQKELTSALLSTFPTRSARAQMLSFGLDKNLDEIAGSGSQGDTTFELVTKAKAQGWVRAHRRRPGGKPPQPRAPRVRRQATTLTASP